MAWRFNWCWNSNNSANSNNNNSSDYRCKEEKLRNKRLTYDKLIRYIFKVYNWRPSDNRDELNVLLEECTVNLALYGNKNLTELLSNLTEHFLLFQNAYKEKNKEKMKQEKKKMKLINQKMKDIIMKNVKNK